MKTLEKQTSLDKRNKAVLHKEYKLLIKKKKIFLIIKNKNYLLGRMELGLKLLRV